VQNHTVEQNRKARRYTYSCCHQILRTYVSDKVNSEPKLAEKNTHLMGGVYNQQASQNRLCLARNSNPNTSYALGKKL